MGELPHTRAGIQACDECWYADKYTVAMEDSPSSKSSKFHVVVGLWARRIIGCGWNSFNWTSYARRGIVARDPEDVRSITAPSGSRFLTNAGYVGLGSTQGVKGAGVYSASVCDGALSDAIRGVGSPPTFSVGECFVTVGAVSVVVSARSRKWFAATTESHPCCSSNGTVVELFKPKDSLSWDILLSWLLVRVAASVALMVGLWTVVPVSVPAARC
jgi:hypothetical protein